MRNTACISLSQISWEKENSQIFEFSYIWDILGIGPKTSNKVHVILYYFYFVDITQDWHKIHVILYYFIVSTFNSDLYDTRSRVRLWRYPIFCPVRFPQSLCDNLGLLSLIPTGDGSGKHQPIILWFSRFCSKGFGRQPNSGLQAWGQGHCCRMCSFPSAKTGLPPPPEPSIPFLLQASVA